MKKLLFAFIVSFSLFNINFCFAQQWLSTNVPILGQINCLAANGSNIFAGGTNQGIYLSPDKGLTWLQDTIHLSDTTTIYSFAIADSNIFAGTSGGVFLSADTGNFFWKALNIGLTTTVISLAVVGPNIYAGTVDGGVFLSADNGVNWTIINKAWNIDSVPVTSIAIKGSYIFAGTSGEGIFLSSDNGAGWTKVNTGLTDTIVLSLAISGGNIFAGTDGGGIFLSANNGLSWIPVNNGLPQNISVNCFAISGTNIFAGAYKVNGTGGVFLSSDNGENWTPENNFPSPVNILSLAITDTNIFAGTQNNGVWKLTLSKVLTFANVLKIDNGGLGIKINPNPVNQSALINYQIPDRSNVIIKVYDLLGKEVETLLNEYNEKGNYTLSFNADNIINGIYFIRMQTNRSVSITRFIKNNF